MNKLQLVLNTQQYAAINVGKLDELKQYLYTHNAIPDPIAGKLFVGELLKSGAMEISFNELPAGGKTPFSHVHHENEEIYIFLYGKGFFEINGSKINVEEGSVIRVAPEVRRS